MKVSKQPGFMKLVKKIKKCNSKTSHVKYSAHSMKYFNYRIKQDTNEKKYEVVDRDFYQLHFVFAETIDDCVQ